ncbi:MAG: NAD(P)-dependent oxidoreductase [Acidimicrobiales bacterium]
MHPAPQPDASKVRAAVLPVGELAVEMAGAVREAGLALTDDPAAADALMWCSAAPDGLPELLASAPQIRWVQLPYAGVERFVHLTGDDRKWTCAKDIYGLAVAELALGLMIMALRRIDRYVTMSSWSPLDHRTLSGAHVVIFGAGGIGRALTESLRDLGSDITIVRRSNEPTPGALTVRTGDPAVDIAVAMADVVVLALPLTHETEGMVDASFLANMSPTGWLVNVARGRIVVTDDLVEALRTGAIAGAALDVTDPEPLPPGHPLWQLSNCIVTPHVANTPALGDQELVRLVKENSRRFQTGEPLLGEIDAEAGY